MIYHNPNPPCQDNGDFYCKYPCCRPCCCIPVCCCPMHPWPKPCTPCTVQVGTTTTGLPGTAAMVTNSGTETNAILDFTIPAGASGHYCSPAAPVANATSEDLLQQFNLLLANLRDAQLLQR